MIVLFARGAVEATLGRPFFVERQGWTLGGELAIGSAIVTHAGPAARFVQKQHKAERTRVYNFEVQATHTYFVGTHNGGLWVHNICRPFAHNAELNTILIQQMLRGQWVSGSWVSVDKYPGGLAGAIRRQLATGELVGGRTIYLKGKKGSAK